LSRFSIWKLTNISGPENHNEFLFAPLKPWLSGIVPEKMFIFIFPPLSLFMSPSGKFTSGHGSSFIAIVIIEMQNEMSSPLQF
jgi:hypothetical protein